MCFLRSQICLQYKTINRYFVKHCTHWILILVLIMKFNLENRKFYLCPYAAGFLKNVFKRQIIAHLKNKNWRKIILKRLGRGSVQNEAQKMNWGGSHSTPPWIQSIPWSDPYIVQPPNYVLYKPAFLKFSLRCLPHHEPKDGGVWLYRPDLDWQN